jgi:hypothetical protein
MKRLHVVTLAFTAVIVLGVIAAATASAETTLLAEWLIKGLAVATLTSVSSTGKILYEDIKLGAAVECEGTGTGFVGANGEGEEAEFLNPKGEAVTLAKPETLTTGCKIDKGCETAGGLEVAPENLPGPPAPVFLAGPPESVKFLGVGFGPPGVDISVTCRIAMIKMTDECEAVEGVTGEVVASLEGAEWVGPLSPNSTCSIGGKGSGVSEPVGPNHLVNSSGEPVIPSSE